MMQNRSRLYILISAFLGVLILTTIVYLVGLSRGRGDVQDAVATAQAQAFLVRIAATETPTNTPTPSDTPTITPTPTNTPTPTASPTSSPTPASPEEWAGRFLEIATRGLNAIAGWEFTSQRAQALLRNAAQQQFLVFAPVSYRQLSGEPWSALVTPRTPDGKALPMLFWQDVNDQNRVRGQLLLPLFDGGDANTYDTLKLGVQQGAMASDPQGRLHALLIERVENADMLPVWLLAQPAPAEDFALVWRSDDEDLWSAQGAGSSVLLDPQEDSFLPDLIVDSPLPAGSSLREILRAPGTFVEQAPFARQWTNTRWTPVAFGNVEEDGSVTGYQLEGAGLRSSPLTSMAQIISLLQTGRLDSALTYATRLDLVQQAFALGLAQPGWWMGIYLDDNGEQVMDGTITSRLQFFDNGERNRSFDASFELDESGFYRLAAIQQAAPQQSDLVTPSFPLPTLTATLEASDTPQGALTAVNTPTALPTALPIGQPTPTWTPTATFTPAPPQSPTATSTATGTATPTETPTALPTDTPTATPLPIPAIPAEQIAPVTGVTNVLEPARLRGGPGVDYPVLVPVGNGLAVGLFGITNTGEWFLIRIDEAGHPNKGLLGWMFRDLVFTQGDLSLLPVYGSDGIALTPVAPAASQAGEGAQPLLPTNTPTIEPSPTSTPLQTPEVRAPTVQQVAQANVPPPEPDEMMATIAGDELPANPLAPVAATAADGREFALRVESAHIEIWAGVLGNADAGWIPAAGELLWPGATVYIRARAPLPAADEVLADRVRIVGAPQQERVTLEDASDFAEAAASRGSVGIVSGGAAGVSVLNTVGAIASLWPDADSVRWLDAGEAGVVADLRAAPLGRHGFLWARTDGAGLRVMAQPFFAISGVAGDPYTGLWWIETPLADTGKWQIWHWDAQSNSVSRRLDGSDTLFATGSPLVGAHLLPMLVAARATTPGDARSMALYVETKDAQTQKPNTGLFRLNLITQDAGGVSELDGAPRVVLAPDSYQSPLALSPDQNRIAFLAYDSDQPSLTSGVIKPANRLKMITLEGRGSSTIRTIYQTETALEFIAPLLAWQDDGTILVARSRFGAAGATGDEALDMFGAVWIELPDEGQAGDASAISVRIPAGSQLRDIAGCRDEQSALLVLLNRDGALDYARWTSIEAITPTFTVPNNLTLVSTCWRNPSP